MFKRTTLLSILLHTHHVPGHIRPITSLHPRNSLSRHRLFLRHFYPHFTDEDTTDSESQEICLRSQRGQAGAGVQTQLIWVPSSHGSGLKPALPGARLLCTQHPSSPHPPVQRGSNCPHSVMHHCPPRADLGAIPTRSCSSSVCRSHRTHQECCPLELVSAEALCPPLSRRLPPPISNPYPSPPLGLRCFCPHGPFLC